MNQPWSVQELKQRLDAGEDVQIIDVREPYEVDIATLGGTNIPMAEVMERLDEIKRDQPVVVHCRSGQRSSAVIDALQRMHGFTNLYNLEGGILAWAQEIDTTLEQY